MERTPRSDSRFSLGRGFELAPSCYHTTEVASFTIYRFAMHEDKLKLLATQAGGPRSFQFSVTAPSEGEVVDELKTQSMWEKTIFVFSAGAVSWWVRSCMCVVTGVFSLSLLSLLKNGFWSVRSVRSP